MQNTSYCVLNSPQMWDRYFDLEIKVRYLAETPGTMGTLIFDCCRDNPAKGEDVKQRRPLLEPEENENAKKDNKNSN